MDAKQIEKIAAELAGEGVLAWEEQADGRLSVINRRGQKILYGLGEYAHLLRRRAKSGRKGQVEESDEQL